MNTRLWGHTGSILQSGGLRSGGTPKVKARTPKVKAHIPLLAELFQGPIT
jgi:hypothetical protein